jgi:hypothetical protein
MGFNPFSGRSLIGLGTLGLSEVVGEDTMSKVPGLNAIGGYQSDSEKALLAKQQQMADDLKKRQADNERQRMNALGQQLLAFNPRNQMMAQVFGPEAAFTPQQMGQMAADPGAKTQDDYHRAWEESMHGGPVDPHTRSRRQPMQGFTAEDLQRMQEDQRRQAMVQQSMTPLGPGPAPLRQVAPQPGRRY